MTDDLAHVTPHQETPHQPDPDRCAVCGWPLVKIGQQGCWRGNCSQRPLPSRFYDPPRVQHEYGPWAPNETDPYDPARDWRARALKAEAALAAVTPHQETPPPNNLLVKVAEEFEKNERESLDTAKSIERRIEGGYNFDGDKTTAAHYRRNAEYFGSRGRAVRAAIAALAAVPPRQEPARQTAWLIARGSSPPAWWTGRGPNEWTLFVDGSQRHPADFAMRFARREDAERAIGWLVKEGVRDGCKAEEHIWG